MTELGDLAPPIMRAAAGLHGHRAGRQRCQERQKLAAAQLLAKDHRARTVSPMELKHVLGEIESDGANLVHERLLEWALIRIPGEGLGLDSWAAAKRVGWCAMSRGGRPWRGLR